MSVASAAASAMRGSGSSGSGNSIASGVFGALGASNPLSMTRAARLARQAAKKRRGRGLAGGIFGKVANAVGGDNGRLDSIESRLDALEGGTEGDVTQPSPTVNAPSTPAEGVGAAPALPEPTMSAAEEMFGGGAIRQIAAGAGKFKK